MYDNVYIYFLHLSDVYSYKPKIIYLSINRPFTFFCSVSNCRSESNWRTCGFWTGPWWFMALAPWLHYCSQARPIDLSPSFFFVSKSWSGSKHHMIISCNRYVMSPPIRKSGHAEALQAALAGGILQVPFFSFWIHGLCDILHNLISTWM